jgi:hypothetical protein
MNPREFMLLELRHTNDERKNLMSHKSYTLRLNFKPDIENDPQSQRDAKFFLEESTKNILPQKKDKKILVGVPAGPSKSFQIVLKSLMQDAFGEVETVPEPLGALVCFQERKKLGNDDIISDVLIIDFGGGTCDFAYTYEGSFFNVRLEEGFYYGGRLFDDLFFQWWKEANPKEAEECRKNSDEDYIFLIKSREAKEKFSGLMQQKRNSPFTFQFNQYGALRKTTWDNFVKRAEDYQPSDFFLRLNVLPENILGGMFSRPMNLLAHFRSLLENVKADYQKRCGLNARFKWVTLAGGSSLWPFVRDDVKAVLSLDDDHILQEPNPFATISKGLAQIPYLRKTLEDRKKKLQYIFLDENGKSNTIIDKNLEIQKNTFIASCLSESYDSIWTRYIKPITLGRIQGMLHDKAYRESLNEQLRDMKNDMLSLWRDESKKVFESLKNHLQKEFREAAGENNLPLSLNPDVNLQYMSFKNLFDSLLPKSNVLGRLLYMLLGWIRRLLGYVFKSKKTARERQQLEEKRRECDEKLKVDIDAFLSENLLKEKIQAQIRGPVERAIKAIEHLQSRF